MAPLGRNGPLHTSPLKSWLQGARIAASNTSLMAWKGASHYGLRVNVSFVCFPRFYWVFTIMWSLAAITKFEDTSTQKEGVGMHNDAPFPFPQRFVIYVCTQHGFHTVDRVSIYRRRPIPSFSSTTLVFPSGYQNSLAHAALLQATHPLPQTERARRGRRQIRPALE